MPKRKFFADNEGGRVSYLDYGDGQYRVRLHPSGELPPALLERLQQAGWKQRCHVWCFARTARGDEDLDCALEQALECIHNSGVVHFNHAVPQCRRELVPHSLGQILADAIHRKRIASAHDIGVRGANIRWRRSTLNDRIDARFRDLGVRQ